MTAGSPAEPAGAVLDNGGTAPPPAQQQAAALHWKQSLTLAKNENIASILLKLERVQSRELAIVAPPHLRAFRNPVSMRLLQRKAEDMGLEVAIITADEMTHHLCAEIGFACYDDEAAFRRANARPWRDQPAAPRLQARPSWLSAVAGLGLVLLIVLVGYFVLPAASITVYPALTTVTIDVPVIADSSLTTADLASGKIPAKVVTSGDVEGVTTVTATGRRNVPNQPARGSVTFTNLTDQPVTVPKSTVLLAGKTAFFTTDDTRVGPSLSIGGTSIPGEASASIQAAQPGPDGNVPAGAITSVQGTLSSKVSVLNPSPTVGGTDKQATYLSADDQARAKQALLETLRQQAIDKIHGQIARNETFLASPQSSGDGAVESATYEESPEQVTTQTRLHMKVLVRGLTFQGDDVNQVVAQAMETAVRQRGNGARLTDAPLTIEPPVVVANDGSTIKLQVHTVGRASTVLQPRALVDMVRGRSPEAARAALSAEPGVGRATVQLWPAWVKTVPSFSWRIHLTVQSAAG